MSNLRFLMAFQDRVAELITQQCQRPQSLLSSSYQFNVPFAKTVVEAGEGYCVYNFCEQTR